MMPSYTEEVKAFRKELAATNGKIDDFLQQYQEDMHGDKKVEGNPGVIGHLRQNREWQRKKDEEVEDLDKRVDTLENSDQRWRIFGTILAGSSGFLSWLMGRLPGGD
jgi:hypothetical protein